MENITWFNKKGRSGSKHDVSVTRQKSNNRIAFSFRNGIIDTLESDYIRIGFSMDEKRIYFSPAQSKNGWKLTKNKSKTEGTSCFATNSPLLFDKLIPYIGDYDFEVSDNNLLYIDSRNRK